MKRKTILSRQTQEKYSDEAATDNDNKIQKKLNFCLLYAKFFFYFQKINLREWIWDVFVRKPGYMLKTEGFV